MEQLERRDLLAADYRNPVDAFDVNRDASITALDALIVINDLSRNRDRTIDPSTAPIDGFFVDVTGDGNASALDALRVINALGRGIRSPYVLTEQGVGASQSVVTIGLGEDAGVRTYRFHIQADFDTSDSSASLEDTFAIYVVGEQSDETLVDRGVPGTSLFTLSGTESDYVPGQVRFDGQWVEFDVTTSPQLDAGRLVLQLIGTDGDSGSVVTVTPQSNTVADASPLAALSLTPISSATPPGDSIEFSSLTPADAFTTTFENIRYDKSTDQLTAELSVRNTGDANGRDVVVVFDEVLSAAINSPFSGTTGDGKPYLNFRPAIASGGLAAGERSDAIEVSISNWEQAGAALVTTVFVGESNRAPTFPAIGPLSVTAGEILELKLQASDLDGDSLQFAITPHSELPNISLSGDRLTISPTIDQIGDFVLPLSVTDSIAVTSQLVDLSVVADNNTTTRISGVVLDTDSNPLSDVPIEIAGFSASTMFNGAFEITLPTLQVPTESFPIDVPRGDVHLDPFGTGDQQIAFRRARFDPATGGSPATH